jgi:hypothetical protein
MDWLALSTSTVTTSSSLLSAMGTQLLAVQLFAFVFEDQHRVELIRADVVEAEVDAQLQRGPEV